MTKTELIGEVAKSTGILQKDVKIALEAAFSNIMETVTEGDDVQLSGFGKFTRVERAARSGTNQFTGKPFKVPAHFAPKFVPARDFKDMVH